MILILTDKNDSHGNYLISKLNEKALGYSRFNLDVESLLNTKVYFEDSIWIIEQNGKSIDLENVACVWNRRTFVELLLEESYDQSVDFKIWKNEWNKTLLGIYSTISHKPWLNPWRKAYEAENKYLQMEFAKLCGFKIPRTIISNDKQKLLNFVSQNKEVVLKLMHQDFYKTEKGDYTGLYVNKIDLNDLENFKELNENPVVLQEYISKNYEVRYTVIGQTHFACKIESQKSEKAKIDWRRYDIPNTPHSILDAPKEIEINVNLLMNKLGIEYGAIDFVVDPNGDWFFLEINSMGQYLWIEDLSGAKITDGIISWFEKNCTFN